MSKRGVLAAVGLALLITAALWSSSLIMASPLMQIDPTSQQGTVAALVQQRFDLTAQAPATKPSDADADQALTATAMMNSLVDTAFLDALAATVNAPSTAMAATVQSEQSFTSGKFIADFLNLTDGNGAQMTTLRQVLEQTYHWTIQDISLDQLSAPGATLYDAQADGQVLVIPGGSVALTDAQLKVIQAYVAQGGNLVILAGTNLNTGKTSTATADNLNTWLMQDFGISFDKDVVIDKTQAYQSPLVPVATDLDASSFITTNNIPSGQSAVAFEVPNSITVAKTAPANVTVTALVRSTAAAYSKTNLQDVLSNKVDKADGDVAGPFVLAADAENTQTKAQVVLLGSTSLGTDRYAQLQGADNLSVTFNSLIWVTGFNDYFAKVVIPQQNSLATAVQQRLEQTQTQAAATATPQPALTATAIATATATPG